MITGREAMCGTVAEWSGGRWPAQRVIAEAQARGLGHSVKRRITQVFLHRSMTSTPP
jgi:hypothetical protein